MSRRLVLVLCAGAALLGFVLPAEVPWLPPVQHQQEVRQP